MSESPPSPIRAELLAAVAGELHHVVSGWRWIAGELLAQESRIDLFGADGEGVAVVVAVAAGASEAGQMERLARLLAWRHWLGPRLVDWLKLAPALGVRPDRPVRALLVCEEPAAELRQAVESLGLPWLQLVRRPPAASGRRPEAVPLERLDGHAPPAHAGNGVLRVPAPRGPGPASPASPAPGAPFRTGLTDADLDLSPAERAEFEPRE